MSIYKGISCQVRDDKCHVSEGFTDPMEARNEINDDDSCCIDDIEVEEEYLQEMNISDDKTNLGDSFDDRYLMDSEDEDGFTISSLVGKAESEKTYGYGEKSNTDIKFITEYGGSALYETYGKFVCKIDKLQVGLRLMLMGIIPDIIHPFISLNQSRQLNYKDRYLDIDPKQP